MNDRGLLFILWQQKDPGQLRRKSPDPLVPDLKDAFLEDLYPLSGYGDITRDNRWLDYTAILPLKETNNDSIKTK